MKRGVIAKLIDELGEPYHEILGIDLSEGENGEVFKWFLASVLFGARISERIAMRTYKQFERDRSIDPRSILARGWSKLVESLDRGGYVRYDFSTASELLELANALMRDYGGSLKRLHDSAEDPADLETRLKRFKGVGDVTTNIFLRELRGIWPKAYPLPQKHVILAARNLRLILSTAPSKAFEELKSVWQARAVPKKTFVNLEIALFRLGKLYCRCSNCGECPLREYCSH